VAKRVVTTRSNYQKWVLKQFDLHFGRTPEQNDFWRTVYDKYVPPHDVLRLSRTSAACDKNTKGVLVLHWHAFSVMFDPKLELELQVSGEYFREDVRAVAIVDRGVTVGYYREPVLVASRAYHPDYRLKHVKFGVMLDWFQDLDCEVRFEEYKDDNFHFEATGNHHFYVEVPRKD
jgi:hypothetical protein